MLSDGDLRRKIEAFARRQSLDPSWEQGLLLALDARNDAVHGGVTLPGVLALRHIQMIGTFLEVHQRVLSAAAPTMRPRILDAFEEVTGTPVPDGLARVVDDFLAPHGLDLIVYCDSPKHPKGPVADAYERTLVIWLPQHDIRIAADWLSLTLARLALAFSLRYQDRLPRARVGELPFDDPGGGYGTVAWALTHAVWEIGIDRLLETYGMTDAIKNNIEQRAGRARERFFHSYDPPPVRSVADFTAHVELTRIVAVVGRSRQQRLLGQVAAVAPDVAHRARRCADVLAAVSFEDHAAVRDALICLHDQSPMLLASVIVAEPETGRLFGDGVFNSWAKGR